MAKNDNNKEDDIIKDSCSNDSVSNINSDNISNETSSMTDQIDETTNLNFRDNVNDTINVDVNSNDLKNNLNNQKKKKILNQDIGNICFLLFLYILQGIPSGLSFSIPLMLSSRKVSYADQGTFSFATWPFSMKILWAPLVDSFYIKRIGRRKSWIIITLFLTGIIMVSFSKYVNQLLDSKRVKQSQDIYILTVIFGTIVALVTTQDVVIDGWSLDLLLKENVQWQATCNSFGMGVGNFIGNAAFLVFESTDFSNKYIRPIFNLPSKPHGIITVEYFFNMIGVVSIVTSILILIFKSENNPKKETLDQKCLLKASFDETRSNQSFCKSIISGYRLVWDILWLKPMKKFILIFLTLRIGFSTESILRLKMVEAGVAREKISLLGMVVSPVLIFLPFFLTKYTNGPRPLDFFRKGYMFKLICALVAVIYIYFTPSFKKLDGGFPIYYYLIYMFISLITSVFNFIMYVSLGSFNAQISDKSIGGTYMTFLSLWMSLGMNWTRTVALYLINFSTTKSCLFDDSVFSSSTISSTFSSYSPIDYSNGSTSITPTLTNNITKNMTNLIMQANKNTCSSESKIIDCIKLGAKCVTSFDSFYPLAIFFTTAGLLWLILTKKVTNHLQNIPKTDWLVVKEIKNNNGV